MNLDQYSAILAKNNFQSSGLQLMFNQKISKDAFKFYVIQKLRIAKNFQRLLAVGIEKAKEWGDQNLSDALERNLMDEQGMDIDGVMHLENSHRYWLNCFLEALDINPNNSSVQPLPSVQAHSKLMFDLEKEGNVFRVGGAILMIERIVPLEYRSVQMSRDHCFPEQFVIRPTDSLALEQRKRLSRKYIDDHIVHDAADHFPNLLASLEKYQENKEALRCIMNGMSLIAKARIAFFNELASAWSKLYHGRQVLVV